MKAAMYTDGNGDAGPEAAADPDATVDLRPSHNGRVLLNTSSNSKTLSAATEQLDTSSTAQVQPPALADDTRDITTDGQRYTLFYNCVDLCSVLGLGLERYAVFYSDVV